MRYAIKKRQIIPTGLAVGDDYVINGCKREMVMELVDKLPFKVKETDEIYSGRMIEISLDVDITNYDEVLRQKISNRYGYDYDISSYSDFSKLNDMAYKVAEQTMLTQIDVDDMPPSIALRSDELPKVVNVIGTFMEDNNITDIVLGGIKFVRRH